MKYLLLVILFLVFSSCDYFDKKKISSEEILQEELSTFNWSEVDEYPSFKICDSSATKELRKQCFMNFLSKHILKELSEKRMVVTDDLADTINMKFYISEKGEISITDILIATKTRQQIPEIDSFLVDAIRSLPKIAPAIKRGQEVKTELKLPIILKAQ